MIEPTGYTKEHRCDAPADCYTTSEVVERLGVSARQLQWWDEHKYVSPLHHAHMRYWTKRDYAEVAILLELRARGMTLASIQILRRRDHIVYRALVVALSSELPREWIIVASPKQLSCWHDPGLAIDAVSAQRGAVAFRISTRIFADTYRRPRKGKHNGTH